MRLATLKPFLLLWNFAFAFINSSTHVVGCKRAPSSPSQKSRSGNVFKVNTTMQTLRCFSISYIFFGGVTKASILRWLCTKPNRRPTRLSKTTVLKQAHYSIARLLSTNLEDIMYVHELTIDLRSAKIVSFEGFRHSCCFMVLFPEEELANRRLHHFHELFGVKQILQSWIWITACDQSL